MANGGFIQSLQRRFRARRMERLRELMGITAATRILDVGGMRGNWDLLEVQPQVVFLNLPRGIEERPTPGEWVFGDGCRLPFQDQSFDLVFSNSVIEHVGSEEAQIAFAREAARVGSAYFVQTPNRWFPVEHHLWTPFLHWLPRSWQRSLVHRCTVWEWLARPRPDQREYYLEHYLNDIRLLDAKTLRRLFPDARIVRERFLGWTKSLIALRNPRS